MTDELNITIKIADAEPIRFPIKREEESIYRTAEYHVNKLYNEWLQSSGKRQSPMAVMARVALAFAELYYRKSGLLKAQTEVLADFERQLDSILEPEVAETSEEA